MRPQTQSFSTLLASAQHAFFCEEIHLSHNKFTATGVEVLVEAADEDVTSLVSIPDAIAYPTLPHSQLFWHFSVTWKNQVWGLRGSGLKKSRQFVVLLILECLCTHYHRFCISGWCILFFESRKYWLSWFSGVSPICDLQNILFRSGSTQLSFSIFLR